MHLKTKCQSELLFEKSKIAEHVFELPVTEKVSFELPRCLGISAMYSNAYE